MNLMNKYFDHTLLKPEATEEQIRILCREAIAYDFYSVCINSCYVDLAAKELSGSEVKISAVIGFPLGAATIACKAFETDEACKAGASEIDMVLNVGKFKSGDLDYVKKDIQAVVSAAAEFGSIVKVILETCLLTDEEIVNACLLSRDAGAYFVKTSTGFNSGGATEHHVVLMKSTVGPSMEVKASGGIRNYETCMNMIHSGAARIGSSASVEIMEAAKTKHE